MTTTETVNGHRVTVETWDAYANQTPTTLGEARCETCGVWITAQPARPDTLRRRIRQHSKSA